MQTVSVSDPRDATIGPSNTHTISHRVSSGTHLFYTPPNPTVSPSPPGQLHQREQEIADLKQRIAEVMAVMPSLSYSSDGGNHSPVAPHYSSKFMDSSPSSLDPNASVYQPLKK